MTYGLFAMRDAALEAAYDRAMKLKAYATAERIAFELNEPGQQYHFPASRQNNSAKAAK